MTRPILLISVGVAASLLSACETVQPWEKATLARPTMQAAGSVPGLVKFDQHIYTSKESVKGGTGIGGGGCGCN